MTAKRETSVSALHSTSASSSVPPDNSLLNLLRQGQKLQAGFTGGVAPRPPSNLITILQPRSSSSKQFLLEVLHEALQELPDGSSYDDATNDEDRQDGFEGEAFCRQ